MNRLFSANEKWSLLHGLMIEYDKASENKTIYDNSYMAYDIFSLVLKTM